MSLHVMPGLYGSTYEKDIDSFYQLYSDPFFKPDEIKFYPTSVIPNTELYDLYIKGEYKPLETEIIQKLVRESFLDVIPPYTRIKRLIRDIPSTEIVAGSNVTNLSQLTHNQMKQELKDTPVLQGLYGRLYADAQVFDTLDQLLASGDWLMSDEISSIDPGLPRSARNDGNMETFVIGQAPDTEQYRNFVSLDTRSREIRNRSQTQ